MAGRGVDHGEGEGDCILHITNAMEGCQRNKQVCEFAWKELDKMSLHLDYDFRSL